MAGIHTDADIPIRPKEEFKCEICGEDREEEEAGTGELRDATAILAQAILAQADAKEFGKEAGDYEEIGIEGIVEGEEEGAEIRFNFVPSGCFDEEEESGIRRGEEAERIGAGEGFGMVKKMLDPRLPTQKEVDLHELNHLPYRNWCPICIQAKGKDMDHQSATDRERGISEYCFDYCFPGDEFGYKLTVLAGRERLSGMQFATTVPTKGSSGKFGVDKSLAFVEEVGDSHGKIIVKTDQEPSIKLFVQDVLEGREEGRTILEESPVKSSGSNGIVERGVQGIEGHVRALFLAFQNRMKRDVDTRERIVTFIPEYAAYLMNRLEVGKDGKVAYERVKGKKPTVLGIEFGEKLLYKVKPVQKMEKINARWEHGIFVGIKRRSGEVWIAIKDKIVSARSVRRIPVEHRWGEDCVKWVTRTPWNRYKDAVDADGDLPEGVPQVEAKPLEMRPGSELVIVETRSKVPREFYIRKEDADKHGYTRGCGGCSSWFKGLGRQPHTDKCRARFAELMKDEAKFKNSQDRKREFEQREVEKMRKKEEKKVEKKRKKEEDEEDIEANKFVTVEEEQLTGNYQGGGSSGSSGTQEMCIDQVMDLVNKWICEVEDSMREQDQEDEGEEGTDYAWDDVHGGELPSKDVRAAREEEVGYMQSRGIWKVEPIWKCFEKTGRGPVSVRWVDTNKGKEGVMEVRSRLVARDFKGKDNKRDDLFAETPPLEAKRMLLSRAVTRRRDRRKRKLLFIDARKAHLNPRCEQDVYIELPEEAGAGPGMCGKLDFWLYGFRPAAAAWEKLYSSRLEGCGFVRGTSCGVVFYHPGRDISCVVHGDDFTLAGCEEDLKWIQKLMKGWFEIKVRAMLGPEEQDDKEVVILGRTVRWKDWGIEYEADPKHRKMILEHFGFDEGSRPLVYNGEKDWKPDEEWEQEPLGREEATTFRGLAARANFLSLDCPDLQFPVKDMSREMSKPTIGSWKRVKKVARYLINRERIVWEFKWQDEAKYSHTCADSDWGGRRGSRKSTSGGMWMMGSHCMKTWSATQGAYALSSAEAEFYAMIEAATRAKGLIVLAREVGFKEMTNVVHLGTDSSAAKSFVSRRGLGKMRHLEIRDLWLQKEVREGKVEVSKVRGTENPADLMTKILNNEDVKIRIEGMNLRVEYRKDLGKE